MVYKRNDGNTAAKDEARTPPDLISLVKQRWNFTIDIAANEKNAIAPAYIRKEFFDGKGFLSDDANLRLDDVAWCNPPYSPGMIPAFVEKCRNQSLAGTIIVMLLPADTSTATYHRFILGKDEYGKNIIGGGAARIIWLWPRVVFHHPEGDSMLGSPQTGSVLVEYNFELLAKNNMQPIHESMRWKEPKVLKVKYGSEGGI